MGHRFRAFFFIWGEGNGPMYFLQNWDPPALLTSLCSLANYKHINTKNHFLGNLLKNTLSKTLILALSNSDTQPSGKSYNSSDLPKSLASLHLYILYPRICTLMTNEILYAYLFIYLMPVSSYKNVGYLKERSFIPLK